MGEYLGSMIPSSPGAKVDKWWLHLRGAWLIQVGQTAVFTIEDAQRAFKDCYDRNLHSVTLLFSHPELRQDISNKGLPIISSPPFTHLCMTSSTIGGILLRYPMLSKKFVDTK
jgi:hypothetical protein